MIHPTGTVVLSNLSWLVPGHLAGMGRPWCAFELFGELLPHEQRFFSWRNASICLSADRDRRGSDIGLGSVDVERRVLAIYRKIRDPWRILESFREGFWGASVDRFVKVDECSLGDLAYVKAQGIPDLVTLTERLLPPE